MRALSDSVEVDSTPVGTTIEINFRLPAAAGVVNR
jgi:hypothetical protein